MNFIDSSVIALAFTPNPKSERCQKAIQEGGVINGLVLMESFEVIKRILKSHELAFKSIRSLMGSGIKIIEVSNDIIFDSIKNDNKLKIFDLVHYRTALNEGCSQILSYDNHFDNLKIKRVEP
ncbi:MAG: type II toxin-antitoxin system VapC family toxin [Candidatus Woesearchaeota archaeon]